ncbi:MAG TPA: hypothetical protein VK698_05710 [Kofleriaceae bacterium]|nr:hypothetical protein [Kofleriaceae bacterium]
MKKMIATAILAAMSLAPLAASAGEPNPPADKPAATQKDKDKDQAAKDKEQAKEKKAKEKKAKKEKGSDTSDASKDKSNDKEATPSK